MSCGMDLTEGTLKNSAKVGGSNIIGLQKWVGPV